MRKFFLLFLLLPFISCTSIFTPKELIDLDIRNFGINMEVRYKSIFDRKTIVFDVKSISSMNSMSDVFRAFLQSADKLQDQTYETVEFACKGKSKFKISGYYFKQLGQEYGIQNVLYTVRTFPENVKSLDDQRVYESWTGGILGVANKQMEDFNSFHAAWYLNDLN